MKFMQRWGKAYQCLAKGFADKAAPPMNNIAHREYWDAVNQNKCRIAYILRNAIANACFGVVIECECQCDESIDGGYTIGHIWGSWANLHLCPNFKKKNPGLADATILHELTHYGASKDDLKVSWEPGGDPVSAYALENIIPWLARWCNN